METIEIELEDGTVLEVSKDFLAASPEEQETFLRDVTGVQRTPAEREQNTTDDILAGLGSSALRLGSRALEFGERAGDALAVYTEPEVLRETLKANANPLDREQANRAQQLLNERIVEPRGPIGRLADTLSDTADEIGRYRGRTSAGDVIDAFQEGRPIQGTLAAARVGVGNAVANAPEFLPYLNPATAFAQAGLNVDESAEARAANDGREEATLGDRAVVAPAEAANAALSRLGVRIPVPQGATGVLARAGIEAATGQVQGQLSDAAQTVGTETGFDLGRNFERGLEENLTGLAGGSLAQLPVEGGRSLVRSADERRVGELTPERTRVLQIEQRATQDILDHMNFLQEQGHQVSLEQDGTRSARTLARRASREYQTALRDLQKVGRVRNSLLTDEDGFNNALEGHFEQLSQAGSDARNLQALPLEEHLAAIDSIDAPDSVKQSLRDQVDYIQSLSGAGIRLRQRSGPAASVLGTYLGILGHAGGFEAGSGAGKTAAFTGATASSNVASNFGRALGNRIDTLTGQSTPDIARDHNIRTRVLAREGLEAAQLDLPGALSSISRQARRRDRSDAIEEYRAMRDNPDTSNVFGSTRLKTIQEHKDLRAGEQLDAIESLISKQVIPADVAAELFVVDPGQSMDRDLFRVLERAIAEEAYSARRGESGLDTRRSSALRKRIDELTTTQESSDE